MTRADIVGGLLLATGFGAVLWEASTFQYGTEFAPGPGFAPIWLAVIGIVLSLLIAGIAWRNVRQSGGAGTDGPGPLDRPGLVRVATTLLGLAGMVVLVPWIGLVLSVFVFLLFLTLVVQRLSPVAGIGASVATVAFIYLVFVRFLAVPVPTGPLGI